MFVARKPSLRLVALALLAALLMAPSFAAQAANHPLTGDSLPAGLAQAVQAALEADGVITPQMRGEEQDTLTASDGLSGDNFAISVALSGDTALVGAYGADVGVQTDAGAAYVFVNSGGVWSQQAKLTASDGVADDNFGFSVALDGDTALVGAILGNAPGQANAGAAYVFVRSGTTWSEQAKLTASDAVAGDYFGWSVALDGDTALVGAYKARVSTISDAGAAYVFTRSGTTWSQQGKLTASDAAANSQFGYSVAVSGNVALVGSITADVGMETDAGAAYVFTRSGTTWSEQTILTASDAAAYEWFGYSVALSGNTALVGAPRAEVNGATWAGAAYVFVNSGGVSEQAKLTVPDVTDTTYLGASVALDGDTALIGARYADPGGLQSAGAAYVFVRSGSTWNARTMLYAADAAANDEAGRSVALAGETALVGAAGADGSTQADAGAAIIYELTDESLLNTDLEEDEDGDKVPDEWKIKTPSGKSKLKCDDPVKGKYYAYTGTCAARLQSTGDKEKLQQTYTPSVPGLAGDAFTLSLWASGSSIPSGAEAKAVVKFTYADGTKEKFTLDLPTGDYAYQQFTLDVTAAQDYTSIKVTIQYEASGGKLYVDDVSLAQTAP